MKSASSRLKQALSFKSYVLTRFLLERINRYVHYSMVTLMRLSHSNFIHGLSSVEPGLSCPAFFVSPFFLLNRLADPVIRSEFISDNELEETLILEQENNFSVVSSFKNNFKLVPVDATVRGFLLLYVCYAMKMNEHIMIFYNDLAVDRFKLIISGRRLNPSENYDLLDCYFNEIRQLAEFSYWYGIPDFDISQGLFTYRDDVALSQLTNVLKKYVDYFLDGKKDWNSMTGGRAVCYPEIARNNFI